MKCVVACFTDVRGPGGGATKSLNVARSLADSGYDVSLISLAKAPPADGVRTVEDIPIRYFSLDAGRAWRVPQLVRQGKLRTVLSEEVGAPDVLLAVSPFFISPARQIWPSVWIVYLFPCLLWRCMPKTWTENVTIFDRFNNVLVGHAERRAFRDSDEVLIQSESVREDVLDFFPQVMKKLRIAPTGVSDLQKRVTRTPAAVRNECQVPTDALVGLSVGHLDVNKNVSHIIKALHDADLPNLWLLVAGDGPEAENLHEQARLGPAADRIRFLGPRSDMPNVFNAADFFIHAAWYDNFPNVYLEAMVSGLPIVGPKGDFPRVVSPIDELIENGKHGFSYRLDQDDALASRLAELANAPDQIKSMGNAARDLALSRFSWERYMEAIESAIHNDSKPDCVA